MWYNMYLLLAMLTSFLETLSFMIVGPIDQQNTPFEKDIQNANFSSRNYFLPELGKYETAGKRFPRISEIKCMQYIYEMVHRQENDNADGSMDLTVINGKTVKATEYPHMGALGWYTYESSTPIFKCGASLISHRFLLTAAHCTYSASRKHVNNEPKIVRLGSRYISDSPYEAPVDYNIEKLIKHPRYWSPNRNFDIALVLLTDFVLFTKFIQPACLPILDRDYSNDFEAVVTGWGTVNAKKYEPSIELLSAVINIFNFTTCTKLLKKYDFRNWRGMQPHQMCAGKLDGSADTCQGDSGGPLQYLLANTTSQGSIHRILGVTGHGLDKCSKPEAPGIYTKVSSFIDWIEDTVWMARE